MNNLFTLRMPQGVYCGPHSLRMISDILSENNVASVAIFTDKGVAASGLLTQLTDVIAAANIPAVDYDDLPPEPAYTDVQKLLDRFLASGSDFILALGGGSVMDTAKLASAASSNYCVKDLLDHPELAQKRVKSLMIPTTAGTGAEATPNAIVGVPERSVKVGIVNKNLIPDFVILDPEMIRSLPRALAASTGVDALSHPVECYTSKKATPFSDLFALEALDMILTNIENACNDPDDMEAKTKMLTGAFYAGIATTCSGTTAVHALSYPLGGTYHIPHGISNAMLLAPVMRFNEPFCRPRFAKVYDRCIHSSKEGATESQKSEIVLERMIQIVHNLDIPVSLSSFGVPKEDLDKLVTAGMGVQRLLSNNMRPVTETDARNIYLSLL